MQTRNPFAANTFAGKDWQPRLVAVPPPPETHERLRPPRSYLAAGASPLDSLVAALGGAGGGRRAPRLEVEKVRYVPTDSEAHLASSQGMTDGPPRFGR